jgi:hypothetical protein
VTRRGAHAGALLCCLLIASPAAAQALTPQQIEDAIAAGRNKREKQLLFTCPAVIGFGAMFRGEKAGINQTGGYGVTVSLPTGRIALLSAAAERFYKHLEPDAVPADLKTMAVIVTAEPGEPSLSSGPPRTASVAAPIQQMIIRDWPCATTWYGLTRSSSIPFNGRTCSAPRSARPARKPGFRSGPSAS